MDEKVLILLVEDDPALGKTLKTGLEREGYQVVWKTHGRKGVSFALEHHPHIILLDVRLPDGSGFDHCAQMRKRGLSQPIIILTVERDETDKVLGLEMGADDYLTKPFSFRELVSRIRAQLRRAYGELSNVNIQIFSVGDIQIDNSAGRVFRSGELLHLSPTAYRLLTFLARNRGRVLSRGQIIREVWGDEIISDSDRIVDVQISRLREKVEKDPKIPELILTVPGMGYRMSEII
ncbi:MAG: response regulator transcription factor [Anaerolineaceae bacterium]|nr:response regulator transcription factor [Anaerolineaceae bacterium]